VISSLRITRPSPLASAVAAVFLFSAPAWATTYNVTTCADAGSGSLRSAVASAVAAGDVVDLSTVPLDCSTITLTTGQIVANNENLSLVGSPDRDIAVSAGYSSRVIDHHGQALTLKYLTVRDGGVYGTSAYGGCIRSNGNVTLFNATLRECSAFAASDPGGTIVSNALGGAVYTQGTFDALFSRVTDSHTYAQASTNASSISYGGGIFCKGDLKLKYSDVSQASAFVAPGGLATGGGVWAGPGHNVSIYGSSLHDNHADFSAGAIWFNAAQADIVNSTISGNSAVTAGAMWIYNGYASIRNSTIAFNNAQNVGGVLSGSHYLELQSTIIAKNTATLTGYPADFSVRNSGIVASGDHNLIVNYPAGAVPGDTLSFDPKLAALADNGGYTLSHALQPGSPAIDKGFAASGLDVDQRFDATHYPRSVGAAPDIGAYERNPDIIFFNGLERKQFRLF
jgi:hypothetical protein